MSKKRKKLNINRVRKYLFQNYKSRFKFKNWDQTLFVGRQVIDELKNYKLTDSHKNIRFAVNIVKKYEHKKKKEIPPPLLPEEYIKNPTPFWHVKELIQLIATADKNIYFYSKYIFNQGENFYIQGGTNITYENYLNDWAKESSKLQNVYRSSGGDDYAPYWIIDGQPKPNPKLEKGKYYAEIVTCNEKGVETKFTEDTYKEVEFVKKEKPEKEPEVEKPTKKPEPEITEKELPPIEKEKLKKQKLETLIAYKESIMKDIEFKEKYKRPTDDLWKKYDKVSEQIDKLME